MKLLTVAIPCYNSEEYMEKSIRSALNGGEKVEVLIIDDGSTDSTLNIAFGVSLYSSFCYGDDG